MYPRGNKPEQEPQKALNDAIENRNCQLAEDLTCKGSVDDMNGA
jgi:hypothetical protein